MANHRNHQIVEHLRDRFKSRHGIELTRDRRLDLINQIKTARAEQVAIVKRDIYLYRVLLDYNHYSVMFDRRSNQITTVLPKVGSPEFREFINKNGLNYGAIASREMTCEERTQESMRNYRHHKKGMDELLLRIENRKRLSTYRAIQSIVNV